MKFLAAFILGLVLTTSAMAEPSFDQIEKLIEAQQYSSAANGLEIIIHNHPNSAKAFYAMAQAQAGMGNQELAKKALDKATGIDPDLKFASDSNVEKLREAITPQTKKIEAIESGHFWRNLLVVLLMMSGIWAIWYYFIRSQKSSEDLTNHSPTVVPVAPSSYASQSPPATTTTASNSAPTTHWAATAPIASTPQPTVVNNHYTTPANSGSNDLLTTMLVMDVLTQHHHDTTHVIEHEVIREVQVPTKDPSFAPSATQSVISSTWDDTPAASKSSSWDDDSSSKSSSSWSSSSDSSSSSSWNDSSSSSSSDSSSSSWD